MQRSGDEHADDEGGDKQRYHGRGGLARPGSENRGRHYPEHGAPGEDQEGNAKEAGHRVTPLLV